MCERNGQTFERGDNSIEITCNPDEKAITWKSLVSSKRGGGMHYCHAWLRHPLNNGRACKSAAKQINDIVNQQDNMDNWTLIPRSEWSDRVW